MHRHAASDAKPFSCPEMTSWFIAFVKLPTCSNCLDFLGLLNLTWSHSPLQTWLQETKQLSRRNSQEIFSNIFYLQFDKLQVNLQPRCSSLSWPHYIQAAALRRSCTCNAPAMTRRWSCSFRSCRNTWSFWGESPATRRGVICRIVCILYRVYIYINDRKMQIQHKLKSILVCK